jgi:hypothetical protein
LKVLKVFSNLTISQATFLIKLSDGSDKIYEFIEESIQTFPSKKTPKELKNFGQNYIFYKSNQRTTWYVFFEQSDNNYLITNIINSNSEEVKFL